MNPDQERSFEAWLKAAGRRSARPAPQAISQRIMARLWQARSASPWRPWGSLALAGSLAGIGLALGLRLVRPEKVAVQFSLQAPRARHVELAGDFTGWKPVPLERQDGRWVLELNLEPGRYEYGYILNGRRFVVDPRSADLYEDRQGRFYSILDTQHRRSNQGGTSHDSTI